MKIRWGTFQKVPEIKTPCDKQEACSGQLFSSIQMPTSSAQSLSLFYVPIQPKLFLAISNPDWTLAFWLPRLTTPLVSASAGPTTLYISNTVDPHLKINLLLSSTLALYTVDQDHTLLIFCRLLRSKLSFYMYPGRPWIMLAHIRWEETIHLSCEYENCIYDPYGTSIPTYDQSLMDLLLSAPLPASDI